MIRFRFIHCLVFLALGWAGCKKGEDYSIVTQEWLVTNPTATPIAAAIRQLRPAPAEVSVVQGQAFGLHTGPRMVLYGVKDSATGAPLRATESISVRYHKLTTIADYILAAKPTLGQALVLSVQGGVEMSLRANGRPLVAEECRVALPWASGASPAGLGTYVGYTNSQGRNLWGPLTPSDTAWRVRAGYHLPTDTVSLGGATGWLTFRTFSNRFPVFGCARPVAATNEIAFVRVSLPRRFNPSNTQVYALSDISPEVFMLDPETNRVEFVANYPYNKYAPVVLVAISRIGTQWYMGRVRTTARDEAAVEMYPDSLSQADLLTRLQNLPN